MKRLLFIIAVLVPLAGFAKTPQKALSKSGIMTAISECKGYQGAEGVHLGRVATSAIKGIMRIAATGDKDAAEALSLMKGVNGISVLDYEDCSASDKASITKRLSSLFSGIDPIIEMVDEGEKTSIYAIVGDKGGTVKDFVLYSPSEESLVCLFGTISVDAVVKLASAND